MKQIEITPAKQVTTGCLPETGYNRSCSSGLQIERSSRCQSLHPWFSRTPIPGVLVTCAGAAAYALLGGTGPGTVLGITSRGWFLRVFDHRIIFLSRETYRSPITINLSGLPDTVSGIEPGSAVQIHEGWITFPNTNLELSVRAAPRWEAAPAPDRLPDAGEVTGRLTQVAQLVFAAKGPAGLTGLLPYLVSLKDEGTDAFAVLPALGLCKAGLQDSRFTGLESGLEAFYGLGSGLTPSGDDLILGMVLALNRCRAWIPDEAGLTRVNEQVVRAAREKTTSLSANLIECATLGQADERLIAALDEIRPGTGQLSAAPRTCVPGAALPARMPWSGWRSPSQLSSGDRGGGSAAAHFHGFITVLRSLHEYRDRYGRRYPWIDRVLYPPDYFPAAQDQGMGDRTAAGCEPEEGQARSSSPPPFGAFSRNKWDWVIGALGFLATVLGILYRNYISLPAYQLKSYR